MRPLLFDRLPSPIGDLLLVHGDDGRLRALEFEDHATRLHTLLRRYHGPVALRDAPAPQPVREALQGYFEGELDRLADIAFETRGTAFQQRVWAALTSIPAGQTLSYGGLAARLGSPGASRAVGLANGANPIALVLPCHRVIGQSGALTGYGGGVWRKRWLLAHETREADLFSAA